MAARHGLIACSLLLGCWKVETWSKPLPSEEETGIAVDEGPDMGVPTWCTPESCDMECALVLDRCGEPMTGWCDDNHGTCSCHEDQPCVFCESDLDCGEWEKCSPVYDCTVCWTNWDIPWDPMLDCTIDLGTLDPILIGYINISIADDYVPTTESCETTPAGMTYSMDGSLQFHLCPDACVAFEQTGELDLEINCPGGP